MENHTTRLSLHQPITITIAPSFPSSLTLRPSYALSLPILTPRSITSAPPIHTLLRPSLLAAILARHPPTTRKQRVLNASLTNRRRRSIKDIRDRDKRCIFFLHSGKAVRGRENRG